MAKKTDSFFVRATLEFDGANFTQTTIDLGAFVDALGRSVLRIHNVDVQWGENLQLTPAANTDYGARMQLTTQTATQILSASDKSIIATAHLAAAGGANSEVVMVSQDLDVAPQNWRNGYLVGVESIYLGAHQNATAWGVGDVSVVLECTVETLSEKAAMALALSQQ